MAATCGASCAKFMLFVFNFIFFLSGVALLGIGIWLLADSSIIDLMKVVSVANDNNDQMKMVSIILICSGAGIFIVGFFGCCGAIRESKCMLGVYIILLLVVMGVEIAAGVLAIVYQDKLDLEGKLNTKLSTELKEDHYYNSTSGEYHPFGLIFNIAQNEFSCCGVNGSLDYSGSTFQKNNPDLKIPYSCCKLKTGASARSPKETDVVNWTKCLNEYNNISMPKDQLHKVGCNQGIIDWANEKLYILIGVALGVAALELFGVVLAFWLCRGIGEEI
ncbi:hypothetical protein NP493_273g01042 [Ridgeia piscesae]|uniref:Tetraspanin n=1 Tax=Ridgeia piscesae TaxID=27915 RepID=A0AAD9NXH5_RIDPI|nr:hypothetical protein NP493_273g01042 [Ridgeia piscesae]